MENEDEDEEPETKYERAARLRSKKTIFYTYLYNIVMNPFYNIAVFLLIIGNTIVLASNSYPQSFEKEDRLNVLNDFFTWAFTVELLIKMCALGFKNYIRDNFNQFDCVVVILSLIDFTMGLVDTGNMSGQIGPLLQAFRAFRLLRVIKVVRRWKKL